MTLLTAGGFLAGLILLYLLYLLLFERGPSYRTVAPVDALTDVEKLRALAVLLGVPIARADTVEILKEGPALYAAQAAAIRQARRSVHLEAYIFFPSGPAEVLLAALAERARAGVAVRVVVDAIGSFRTSRACFAALRAAGGTVHFYHPLRWHMFRRWNSRTHRNLLLIDGATAFIGGAGVAEFWSRPEPPPWRDCVARVTGPVVHGLQAVFAENWLECAGELLVGAESFPDALAARGDEGVPAIAVGSTPTAGRSTRARILVQFALAMARESIELCSPYFIPDFGIRRELIAARERGVRVRILTGGPYSDHAIVRRAGRRRYGALLQAGVEISEYASHMMHVKLLVIDGRWVLLGSTNIDHRSFVLNDEVNLLVLDPALAARLRGDFETDLLSSDPETLARWRARSWRERALATLGRVLERHQ